MNVPKFPKHTQSHLLLAHLKALLWRMWTLVSLMLSNEPKIFAIYQWGIRSAS